MKRKIYAISLLLSFLVVLSHQVISHHHHDSLAYDFTTSIEKVDGHKHEHNDKHHHHDSQDENNNEKGSDKEHKHPFPLHDHVSATDDFDFTRANILDSNTNIPSVKIFAVLCVFLKEYSEPLNFTNYNFGEPPFLINSLFEPGAIALRGPPSIV